MDTLEQMVKINEVARPYKDTNFHFMVGGMDCVGVSGVVLRVKPGFVGARIRKIIIIFRLTPMEAEP